MEGNTGSFSKVGLREIIIRPNTYRVLCASASHRLTDLILINTEAGTIAGPIL